MEHPDADRCLCASDLIAIDYAGADGGHHVIRLNASRRLAQRAQETVSTPGPPAGPLSGSAGVSYRYTTGGATSSLRKPVQYWFDWGDGTNSGWLPVGVTSAQQSWETAGSYPVAVQARSAADRSIVSSMSLAATVKIGPKL
jgi:hypothetical protein